MREAWDEVTRGVGGSFNRFMRRERCFWTLESLSMEKGRGWLYDRRLGEESEDGMGMRNLRFVAGDDAEVEELPWGPHEWLSRPGLTEADELLLVRVTMPPGTGHAFHRHPHMEEIIYVVSGEAEQWVDREKRTLGPGEIAHIPRDMVHGTYNEAKTPLVFLAILAPAKNPGPPLIDVSQESPWNGLRNR